MSEHERSSEPTRKSPEEHRARHRRGEPGPLEWQPAANSDVGAMWREGYSRWGWSFAAYVSLNLSEARTTNVLSHFENLYSGSFPSLEAVVDMQIRALGWRQALDELREAQGIQPHMLEFDRASILDAMSEIYSMIEIGGEVHLFAL